MTAAGSAITAAWINSDSAILTISGTSMPLFHVAGVGTKMCSEASYSPCQLHDAHTGSATAGMVTCSQASGHNKLSHSCTTSARSRMSKSSLSPA